jgi:hypothetical protein
MLPSKTPEPLPSITATMIVAQPENFSRLGQNELLIIVIIVVVLVIIGYLVLKKSRSKTTK